MVAYARSRFGETLVAAQDAFADAEAAFQLFMPWSLYHFLIDGRPVAEWFAADPEVRLTEAERAWLAAQRAAWLGIWEVIDVIPGQQMTMTDLLTGEQRVVVEASGSRNAVARDAVLARVVDYQGESLLAGVHPQPLAPHDAAEVLREMRGRLRRRGLIPVERLRRDAIERFLIARWEDAVDLAFARAAVPPQLSNTDGDELVFTTDHFAFDAASRAWLEAQLAALEHVHGPERDDNETIYTFLRPAKPGAADQRGTIIGTIRLTKSGLLLETNSLKRADRLRKQLETATSGRLRHRAREHSSPFAPPGPSRGKHAPEVPPEIAGPIIQQYLKDYYTDWLDQPIPALDGATPRQAVLTRTGRQQLEVLLKSFEHNAGRSPGGTGPDVGWLRRELGLGQ